jgi:hypothetical protein
MSAWDMQPDGSYVLARLDDEGKQRHPQKRLLKVISNVARPRMLKKQ